MIHLQRSKFDLAMTNPAGVVHAEWNWREKDMVIEMDLPSTAISTQMRNF